MVVTPEVEAYCAALAAPRDETLRGMEALAAERDFPIVLPLRDGLSVRLQIQLHKHVWDPSRRGV